MIEIGTEEEYLFTITYEKILDSDLELNSLETVSIQIKPKCANTFVIISLVLPPKHKIDDILNIEILHKSHEKSNTEVIIMRGSNCDVLPDQDKSSIAARLRTLYEQYVFKQSIRKVTRTANRSSTLLDHFANKAQQYCLLRIQNHNIIRCISDMKNSKSGKDP